MLYKNVRIGRIYDYKVGYSKNDEIVETVIRILVLKKQCGEIFGVDFDQNELDIYPQALNKALN